MAIYTWMVILDLAIILLSHVLSTCLNLETSIPCSTNVLRFLPISSACLDIETKGFENNRNVLFLNLNYKIIEFFLENNMGMYCYFIHFLFNNFII